MKSNLPKTLVMSVLCGVLVAASVPRAAALSHAFVWDSAHGMQDLGTLGGAISYATGINDKGQVCGYSVTSTGDLHAFIWSRAQGMVDIGARLPATADTQVSAINASGSVAATVVHGQQSFPSFFLKGRGWVRLPGPYVDEPNESFGINDSNQVTGQLYDAFVLRGFLWDPLQSTVTYLPTLPGGTSTVGNAISNLTHITGTADVTDGSYHGLFWSASGGSVDMGSFGGSSYTAGRGINANDEVVGNNTDGGGFYWTASSGFLPLQALTGSVTQAFAINDSGAIAGYSSAPGGGTHAVLWSNHASAPQDLGALISGGNSYASGINNSGQVAGYADAH